MIKKESPNGETYCSNGEFILAMWLLEYEMKTSPSDIYNSSINAIFNCSHRDLSKVVCDCGLQYTRSSKRQHENSSRHNLIINAMHVKDTDTEFNDFLSDAIERLS